MRFGFSKEKKEKPKEDHGWPFDTSKSEKF
jgi:hypothetical protein